MGWFRVSCLTVAHVTGLHILCISKGRTLSDLTLYCGQVWWQHSSCAIQRSSSRREDERDHGWFLGSYEEPEPGVLTECSRMTGNAYVHAATIVIWRSTCHENAYLCVVLGAAMAGLYGYGMWSACRNFFKFRPCIAIEALECLNIYSTCCRENVYVNLFLRPCWKCYMLWKPLNKSMPACHTMSLTLFTSINQR
jgi:hypothetical protein